MIGMGNTCKPMAVSFQCMTKFTTNKKKNFKKRVGHNLVTKQHISGRSLPVVEFGLRCNFLFLHVSCMTWD